MTQHFHFSHEEIRDSLVSIAALTIGFTIALFQPGTVLEAVVGGVVTLLIVAVTFFPRELSQRSAAKALNCYVKYELWPTGAILAVVTSFLGFVFAAPGGVNIGSKPQERYGRWWVDLTPQQIGIVASSGPLISIGLAMTFFLVAPLAPSIPLFPAVNVFGVAAKINAVYALSTLIPFSPLDGAKVMRWNAGLWFFSLFTAAALLFFAVWGGV